MGIIYEPRLAKLHLANEDIDEEAEEIAKNAPADEANRLKWAAIEDAAGSEDRVNKVAEDVLSHFLARTETLPGKAMIVCMSRKNCVKMHDALIKLENCPEIAVVMTGNIAKDPREWNPHIRAKENHEALKKRFKAPEDPLKIVIVRDMRLTGFDAPCVHSIYVDKIMKGHNLMQAIARVNRVFKDKPSDEIVDVYKMAGIEKPDISILNERFLLGAKEEKEGANIKIELLRQILNNEIKLRKRTNIKKYTSLKKELVAEEAAKLESPVNSINSATFRELAVPTLVNTKCNAVIKR